jgi:predicted Zn-dependent peptidase
VTAPRPAFGLEIPVIDRRLANGLRVLLSPDHSAPIVTVAVYYHVGMRLEPRGRTGFAHLFEHLMFQGSSQLGKMELARLVQESGGNLNGSTSSDFTNYYEVLPKHALELALWAEADRMRGPVITQAELDNQRDVVKNEVRVNVLNRPYGGFPWLDLHEHAFTNWHNAHNGYGDMIDLDAASMGDVTQFFDRYYAPGNAALVLVGDFDVEQAFTLADRHFGALPSHELAPPADLAEPRQEEERRATKTDPHASRPALAFGYHTPARGTPQFAAMGVLDQLLVQGDDALLHRRLVNERGLTAGLSGGINLVGNMYGAATPLLWHGWLVHDRDTTPDEILEVVDSVIEPLRNEAIDVALLGRARVKARSAYYDLLSRERYPGMGRAGLLASFAMLDDRPQRVNDVDAMYAAVTADTILETAREFLRPSNRTVIVLEAGAQ